MDKLRTNEKALVKIAVQGSVAPAYQFAEFEVSHTGNPFCLPSTGGIVYNVKTGDNAFEWEADHVEPGVSAVLDDKNRSSKANLGFNFLACVGNTARIVSGDAKGRRGVVTGHHGGVEHVTIDFDDAALAKLNLNDRILIEGYGQGLKLLDYPEIKVFNLDPLLLHKMPIWPLRNGKLEVGVTKIVPASLMGSGMGHNNIGTGDCDIMTHDPVTVKKLRLDQIALGDFIAVADHDHSFGRTYKLGAVTIGVVIHGNSNLPGHGPGLSTLLTSAHGAIVPVLNPRANLARVLGLGRYRK